ncbi:MAG: winged helix-turn-helix transcriptional regulator [Chloroflexi bacterium]|jgi:DNA-binding MarR family transcriptional regulator|nr:winged helix-turn-helix transcriptional regulator [Chloroflexota bacterium]
MGLTPDHNRDLIILEHIEQDPDATQATLASQLGVAVGTVNWHLKRLISKGYIKVRRVERRKLRYIITPEGIALRARLALDYIQNSFRLYRLVRQRVLEALEQVEQAGYQQVRLEGEGDVAEICRLTCLEHNITIAEDPGLPVISIHGLKIFVNMDGRQVLSQDVSPLSDEITNMSPADHEDRVKHRERGEADDSD